MNLAGKVILGLCCALFLTIPVSADCPTADLTNDCKVDLADFSVLSQQWLLSCDTEDLSLISAQWQDDFGPSDMVWVYIDDSGISGHEGFNGYMSKYETTNAQYCQFLNAAKASGDIVVSGNDVNGANGSNSGTDFSGQPYYDLSGSSDPYNGATNGGAARINWTGSAFTVDSGFENHPVTSW